MYRLLYHLPPSTLSTWCKRRQLTTLPPRPALGMTERGTREGQDEEHAARQAQRPAAARGGRREGAATCASRQRRQAAGGKVCAANAPCRALQPAPPFCAWRVPVSASSPLGRHRRLPRRLLPFSPLCLLYAHMCASFKHLYVHMREADGEDPNSLYSKQEIYHSWHDEDAIVVPSSCAHVLRGEERVKTVMWGRWQLRNESSGLFQSLSLGPLSFLARFRRVPPLPSVHICACYSQTEKGNNIGLHDV